MPVLQRKATIYGAQYGIRRRAAHLTVAVLLDIACEENVRFGEGVSAKRTLTTNSRSERAIA